MHPIMGLQDRRIGGNATIDPHLQSHSILSIVISEFDHLVLTIIHTNINTHTHTSYSHIFTKFTHSFQYVEDYAFHYMLMPTISSKVHTIPLAPINACVVGSPALINNRYLERTRVIGGAMRSRDKFRIGVEELTHFGGICRVCLHAIL